MCSLYGELTAVETQIQRKRGIVAYKVVMVPKKLNAMTALYVHRGNKRRSYNFNTLTRATLPRIEEYRGSGRSVAGRNSSSGFYVFNTYYEALKQRKLAWDLVAGYSIARVRCFGRATLYSNGMRVEKMIVESIVCGRRPKI